MRKMYVGGKWVESNSSNVTAVLNPATEEVLIDVQNADELDVGHAVEVADQAFQEWRWITGLERHAKSAITSTMWLVY